jgi:hypothetical protein
MALCPDDGTTLTALVTGVANRYVCSACKKHFMGTGGILLPSAYTAGGQVSMNSSLINVTHGLGIQPTSGDVVISATGTTTASGARLYVSGYSSTTFSVTFEGVAVATSGIAFAWNYSSL